MELKANNRVAKKPGNLEFDNLSKKNWNLRNFGKKPGILYKNHGKPGTFFNLNFLTILM